MSHPCLRITSFSEVLQSVSMTLTITCLIFQRMIQEIIVAQPADPLEHMINILHRENDDGWLFNQHLINVLIQKIIICLSACKSFEAKQATKSQPCYLGIFMLPTEKN